MAPFNTLSHEAMKGGRKVQTPRTNIAARCMSSSCDLHHTAASAAGQIVKS